MAYLEQPEGSWKPSAHRVARTQRAPDRDADIILADANGDCRGARDATALTGVGRLENAIGVIVAVRLPGALGGQVARR
jgi:hypothetical protein